MNEKTLEEMSGENLYKKPAQLILNEIRINGKKGKFFFRDVIGGLKEIDGKKRYEQKEIGEEVSVIFLKIRRKLRQYRKEENPLTTSEHNHKDDIVALFGNPEVEKGKASDLREKYQGLRTQQIIYAIYGDELVRVLIKGSALGSKSKKKDVMAFYEYISSFKEDGKDEHFYNFITKLYAVEEVGELGEYYTMSFKKDRELTEEEKKLVAEKMLIAFNFCKGTDEYYNKGKAEEIKKVAEKEEIETVEYPEDEIVGEEILF